LAAVGLLSASSAQAELIFGLTNLREIVTIDSTTLMVNSSVGLAGNEDFVSIDVRPATGELFGFTASNKLFTINPSTGGVTEIPLTGPAVTAGLGGNIDFNPTVDRIRLTGTNDTNYRLNPTNGAVTVDGMLAFSGGSTDGQTNPNIVNISYINNVPQTTATTLYGLDSATNELVTISPPNDGVVNPVAIVDLPFAAGGFTGFDTSGRTGISYVSNGTFGTGAADTLYSIDLGSGNAFPLGTVAVNGILEDITVAGVIPEPASLSLLGLAGIAILRRRA
jgi:hypothetical protein